MVTEVIALVDPDARRSGIVCKAEVSNVGELQADPALLRQALLNLALNGIQAMPNGGKLTMGAKTTKDRRVSLTIEDTGVGISADKLDRIFDLYYTTKPEGSGIGLSIVYRIVQLHGGEIEVQSIEGRGTTFRLLLPQT
jgi:signal transduction histidine kinase